jgi:hypothetical protein
VENERVGKDLEHDGIKKRVTRDRTRSALKISAEVRAAPIYSHAALNAVVSFFSARTDPDFHMHEFAHKCAVG